MGGGGSKNDYNNSFKEDFLFYDPGPGIASQYETSYNIMLKEKMDHYPNIENNNEELSLDSKVFTTYDDGKIDYEENKKNNNTYDRIFNDFSRNCLNVAKPTSKSIFTGNKVKERIDPELLTSDDNILINISIKTILNKHYVYYEIKKDNRNRPIKKIILSSYCLTQYCKMYGRILKIEDINNNLTMNFISRNNNVYSSHVNDGLAYDINNIKNVNNNINDYINEFKNTDIDITTWNGEYTAYEEYIRNKPHSLIVLSYNGNDKGLEDSGILFSFYLENISYDDNKDTYIKLYLKSLFTGYGCYSSLNNTTKDQFKKYKNEFYKILFPHIIFIAEIGDSAEYCLNSELGVNDISMNFDDFHNEINILKTRTIYIPDYYDEKHNNLDNYNDFWNMSNEELNEELNLLNVEDYADSKDSVSNKILDNDYSYTKYNNIDSLENENDTNDFVMSINDFSDSGIKTFNEKVVGASIIKITKKNDGIIDSLSKLVISKNRRPLNYNLDNQFDDNWYNNLNIDSRYFKSNDLRLAKLMVFNNKEYCLGFDDQRKKKETYLSYILQDLQIHAIYCIDKNDKLIKFDNSVIGTSSKNFKYPNDFASNNLLNVNNIGDNNFYTSTGYNYSVFDKYIYDINNDNDIHRYFQNYQEIINNSEFAEFTDYFLSLMFHADMWKNWYLDAEYENVVKAEELYDNKYSSLQDWVEDKLTFGLDYRYDTFFKINNEILEPNMTTIYNNMYQSMFDVRNTSQSWYLDDNGNQNFKFAPTYNLDPGYVFNNGDPFISSSLYFKFLIQKYIEDNIDIYSDLDIDKASDDPESYLEISSLYEQLIDKNTRFPFGYSLNHSIKYYFKELNFTTLGYWSTTGMQMYKEFPDNKYGNYLVNDVPDLTEDTIGTSDYYTAFALYAEDKFKSYFYQYNFAGNNIAINHLMDSIYATKFKYNKQVLEKEDKKFSDESDLKESFESNKTNYYPSYTSYNSNEITVYFDTPVENIKSIFIVKSQKDFNPNDIDYSVDEEDVDYYNNLKYFDYYNTLNYFSINLYKADYFERKYIYINNTNEEISYPYLDENDYNYNGDTGFNEYNNLISIIQLNDDLYSDSSDDTNYSINSFTTTLFTTNINNKYLLYKDIDESSYLDCIVTNEDIDFESSTLTLTFDINYGHQYTLNFDFVDTETDFNFIINYKDDDYELYSYQKDEYSLDIDNRYNDFKKFYLTYNNYNYIYQDPKDSNNNTDNTEYTYTYVQVNNSNSSIIFIVNYDNYKIDLYNKGIYIISYSNCSDLDLSVIKYKNLDNTYIDLNTEFNEYTNGLYLSNIHTLKLNDIEYNKSNNEYIFTDSYNNKIIFVIDNLNLEVEYELSDNENEKNNCLLYSNNNCDRANINETIQFLWRNYYRRKLNQNTKYPKVTFWQQLLWFCFMCVTGILGQMFFRIYFNALDIQVIWYFGIVFLLSPPLRKYFLIFSIISAFFLAFGCFWALRYHDKLSNFPFPFNYLFNGFNKIFFNPFLNKKYQFGYEYSLSLGIPPIKIKRETFDDFYTEIINNVNYKKDTDESNNIINNTGDYDSSNIFTNINDESTNLISSYNKLSDSYYDVDNSISSMSDSISNVKNTANNFNNTTLNLGNSLKNVTYNVVNGIDKVGDIISDDINIPLNMIDYSTKKFGDAIVSLTDVMDSLKETTYSSFLNSMADFF